jgi:RNA polymerase sigma-70 factor, ECF subfamily
LSVTTAHRRRGLWTRWRRSGYREQELVSEERSSSDRLETREANELVYRALDGMNERYRTAIILFEIEDLSGEEVAERMQMKLANLWVVLHRARAELVRRLSRLREESR